MVLLDEPTETRLLGFIADPVGPLACCRRWHGELEQALQLKQRVEFHKAVRAEGRLCYTHTAVRSFGGDMAECVSYSFRFLGDGSFELQWSRGFDIYSAANERQRGRWRVEMDEVRCETEHVDNEREDPSSRFVRFSPGGRVFKVPIKDILKRNTSADELPAYWELACRGASEASDPFRNGLTAVPKQTVPARERAAVLVADNSRFVEIDGDMVQVSGDIVSNAPESDWARLMRVRLRFGLC